MHSYRTLHAQPLSQQQKLIAHTECFELLWSAVPRLAPVVLQKTVYYTPDGTESFRICPIPSEKPGKQ